MAVADELNIFEGEEPRMESGFDSFGQQLQLTHHHHYRMGADGTTFVNAAGEPVDARNAVPTEFRFADVAYPLPRYDQVDVLFEPSRAVRQKATVTRNGPNTTFVLALNRTDQRGAAAANGEWRNQARMGLDHRIVTGSASSSLRRISVQQWMAGISPLRIRRR